MDAKSLAKSKRAHTQHNNKKFHPNPKSKKQPTTVSSSSSTPSNLSKKPASKQQNADKSRKNIGTNWDRYEEEFDDSETSFIDQKYSDVVLPKSKGADFGHLISEAKSKLEYQINDGSGSSQVFGSVVDHVFSPGFDQGMSSMFSMRGNRMSSWMAENNFVVDDSSATFNEVPFLSMDLHSLASKLETLDVAQRLFIEADIFPERWDVDKSEETNVPESEKAENRASGPNEQCLDENKFLRHSSMEKGIHHSTTVIPSTATSHCSLLPDPHQGAVLVDQGRKDMPSSTTRSSILVRTLPCEVTSLMNPVKDDLKQMEQSSYGEVVDSIAQINLNDVEDLKEKSSTFEALAAEAELDMLLNSFGETKFLDTSGISKKSANNLPVEWDDSTSLSKENTAVYPSKQLSDKSSKSARNIPVSVDINCTIDDLLRETSNPNVQNNAFPPQKVVVPPYVPASSSNSKVLLDDFDSWLDTI